MNLKNIFFVAVFALVAGTAVKIQGAHEQSADITQKKSNLDFLNYSKSIDLLFQDVNFLVDGTEKKREDVNKMHAEVIELINKKPLILGALEPNTKQTVLHKLVGVFDKKNLPLILYLLKDNKMSPYINQKDGNKATALCIALQNYKRFPKVYANMVIPALLDAGADSGRCGASEQKELYAIYSDVMEIVKEHINDPRTMVMDMLLAPKSAEEVTQEENAVTSQSHELNYKLMQERPPLYWAAEFDQ